MELIRSNRFMNRDETFNMISRITAYDVWDFLVSVHFGEDQLLHPVHVTRDLIWSTFINEIVEK